MAESAKLKLNAIWGKTFLGLAIEQVIGNYNFPITPYYFWPRTEAWKQLKLELELKTWIPQEEKIRILNSATKLINLCMQEYQNKESIENIKDCFKELNQVESSN